MVYRVSTRLTFFLCCFFSSIGIIIYNYDSVNISSIGVLLSGTNSKIPYTSEVNKSWPNYKYIWRDFYGEIPDFYNCREFVKGNATAISHYNFVGRIALKEEPTLSMQCDHIRLRVMGNTVYKRVKNPFVVARNVYKDYHIQELLLAFSYSPSNTYCFAIDKKSGKTFKKKLKQLSSCLPNVIILEKEYAFNSAGHFQDKAHYDCTVKMFEYKNWKYVLFVQNDDILIKTPEEISEILSVANGMPLTAFSEPFISRIPKSKWTAKDIKLFKNESIYTKEQLTTPLLIRKSGNQMMLSRRFMESVYEQINLETIFHLFNSKKYGVDEMLFPTLLKAHFLNLPDQIENKCTFGDTFFRFVHWNFGNEKSCQSFKLRHGVCLVGVEYIPIFEQKAYVIANKIWPEWDFGAIMCIGEALYNRTNIPSKRKFNIRPYQRIPQVREQELRTQEKFNITSFQC